MDNRLETPVPDAATLIARLRGRERGIDLETDAEFVTLAMRVEGRPDAQYGDRVFAAPPTDWLSIENTCLSMLERSCDLRVAVWLTRAWMERRGLEGFASGLDLIVYVVSERWQDAWPELYDEDGADPVARVNALVGLSSVDVLSSLGRWSLPSHPLATPLRLRDALAARTSAETQMALSAWAASIDVERFSSFASLIDRLIDSVDGVVGCLDREANGSNALEPLSVFLRTVSVSIAQVARQASQVPRIAEPSAPAPVVPGATPCSSRDDVYRLLDAVSAYYVRCEPSSPVPFLVERVRRLASLDFLGVVDELSPSAGREFRDALGASTDD
ncbi:type VI secretion system protein ImpA [Luteibacter sp. Sphag1AF]|uniref:type VI secretion system protein TssA n=1 Tax=Luteibacter sp. Sphag1AF TaxID=2587031 RepID=UPI00161FAE5D|nr:type VI secretion system ImpA family N-terminal domain-containing protein [Luteibacter sp. Sphag1AF]MBB3226957.1 type VI secretion system protein ImpA [Luteibacter sp. Sphag1AF]